LGIFLNVEVDGVGGVVEPGEVDEYLFSEQYIPPLVLAVKRTSESDVDV